MTAIIFNEKPSVGKRNAEIIGVCEKEKRWEGALTLLQEMVHFEC